MALFMVISSSLSIVMMFFFSFRYITNREPFIMTGRFKYDGLSMRKLTLLVRQGITPANNMTETHTHSDTHTETQTERQTDIHRYKQMQTHRQTHRCTDTHTKRHTHTSDNARNACNGGHHFYFNCHNFKHVMFNKLYALFL